MIGKAGIKTDCNRMPTCVWLLASGCWLLASFSPLTFGFLAIRGFSDSRIRRFDDK
jgi:hypothetical protein